MNSKLIGRTLEFGNLYLYLKSKYEEATLYPIFLLILKISILYNILNMIIVDVIITNISVTFN